MRVLIGCLCLAGVASAYGYDVETWRFKASVGDRNIGEHRFVVERSGARTNVSSSADFEVKLWFIKAFGYKHRASEQYDGGCLTGLDAFTQTAGEVTRVSAQRTRKDILEVRAPAGTVELHGCYLSFAYWSPDLLAQRRLINPQTGELVDVEIHSLGAQTFADSPALAYGIKSAELDIRLWYGRESGQWLGLESTLDDGKVLRYEPLDTVLGTRR